MATSGRSRKPSISETKFVSSYQGSDVIQHPVFQNYIPTQGYCCHT